MQKDAIILQNMVYYLLFIYYRVYAKYNLLYIYNI